MTIWKLFTSRARAQSSSKHQIAHWHVNGGGHHNPLFDHGKRMTSQDRPDFDYRRRSAFDMEASGFYATALRFSPPQLVHCLKVISDNREQSGWGISGATVRHLIEGHLDLLEELLNRLTARAEQLTRGNRT